MFSWLVHSIQVYAATTFLTCTPFSEQANQTQCYNRQQEVNYMIAKMHMSMATKKMCVEK